MKTLLLWAASPFIIILVIFFPYRAAWRQAQYFSPPGSYDPSDPIQVEAMTRWGTPTTQGMWLDWQEKVKNERR